MDNQTYSNNAYHDMYIDATEYATYLWNLHKFKILGLITFWPHELQRLGTFPP
jgi:hypothetical protein